MPHRRSLSVQSKLLVSFVLLTIAGITVLTGVGYLTARQSLTASAERQLLGLQRSKAGIVKSMLTSMRNEVLAFSAADVVTRAAVALRAAHRDLATCRSHAQNDRGRDAVSPAGVRARPSPRICQSRPQRDRRCRRAPRSGTSTTTTSCRRPSLTGCLDHSSPPPTPAATGPQSGKRRPVSPRSSIGWDSRTFCSSIPRRSKCSTATRNRRFSARTSPADLTPSSNFAALARTLSTSKDVDDYRVADFEAYRPRLGAPGAFIGTPVFDGPRMVAVMLLRFRLEPISDALSGGRQ